MLQLTKGEHHHDPATMTRKSYDLSQHTHTPPQGHTAPDGQVRRGQSGSTSKGNHAAQVPITQPGQPPENPAAGRGRPPDQSPSHSTNSAAQNDDPEAQNGQVHTNPAAPKEAGTAEVETTKGSVTMNGQMNGRHSVHTGRSYGGGKSEGDHGQQSGGMRSADVAVALTPDKAGGGAGDGGGGIEVKGRKMRKNGVVAVEEGRGRRRFPWLVRLNW